jgi:hypothetical protein
MKSYLTIKDVSGIKRNFFLKINVFIYSDKEKNWLSFLCNNLLAPIIISKKMLFFHNFVHNISYEWCYFYL